ncbi:MAG TPA: solute:sodium symporter family transporter [Clostridiaceae bacterium]|nr:solute:sodium symporter family transporter [Clostridiaceae bacterium]
MMAFTIVSFIAFTVLVAVIAWRKTRSDKLDTKDGYFLAGRSLTAPVIAGSLMLTNLSTEQLVGQAGQSFATNMGPIAWEATSGLALIMLALIFLPRYLKLGITTIPEFLEKRFDATVKRIISVLFLLGYLLTYLPTVLYSGALVFNHIFGIDKALGVTQLQGVAVTATIIGIAGAIYAIFGGLKAVAVSDTVNGVGLLIGGILLPVMTLYLIGKGSIGYGLSQLIHLLPAEKFNAVNPANAQPPMIPWPLLFTGMVINNMFYWCTNQAIIQRTLGAKNLKEAQKGALFCAMLKFLTPLFITSCGLLAYFMYQEKLFTPDQIQRLGATNGADLAYPMLLLHVIPKWLLGFFAAVLFGAILSSFNSALNSSVTLYTLDLHRPLFNPQASDEHLVKIGKRFGTVLAVVSIAVAPLVSLAPTGLYDFLQACFGFFNVPILASVIIGISSKRVPALAPKVGLITHVVLYSASKFMSLQIHYLYVLFVLFLFNIVLQVIIGKIAPRATEFKLEDAKAVDTTPWKYRKVVAGVIIILMALMYSVFSPLVLAR